MSNDGSSRNKMESDGAATSTQSVDVDPIARNRRHSLTSIHDIQADNNETSWDAVVVEEKDEINDLDSHKISTLMRESADAEQKVLRIAACLSSLDKRLLEASTSSKIDVSDTLSDVMAKGLVMYTNEEYVFASDTMLKALYRSIPQEEKSRQHVAIGRRLVENLSQQELEKHYYTVLRQFHLGVDVITDQSERYSIAILCLRAAELAVSNGSFKAASRYLNFGMELLGPDCWKDHYHLTLALYNDSAEVEYSKSNFDRVDSIVSAILENARFFRDTLRARAARIYAQSSRYKMAEAVEESLDVLDRLGEPLPSDPTRRNVLFAFWRTKRLLRGKTSEMILRMPLMTNPDKMATSQILNLMFPSTFRTRPLLFALVVLRLVRLTMKFGLNAVSAVGFGYYGSILCAFSGSIDEGYRYGQVALALLDKFHTKEWIPRVYLGVYGHIGSYKLPLQEMYTHLERAQQIGLETGDIEVGICDMFCTRASIFSSHSLALPPARSSMPAIRQTFSAPISTCRVIRSHSLRKRQ